MNSSPVILSLETATLGGTVFLGRGADALAAREGNPNVSHSNSILSDVNECLNDAGLILADVELFACASGPGSFTGLRIGIATLKALAATLERPCVGVSTLSAIAQGAGVSNATVALLPAGRGEVFAQMFSVTADDVTELDTAAHLSPQRLIERYQRFPGVVWTGPGAQLHRALLRDHAKRQGVEFSEPEAYEAVERNGWQLRPQQNSLAQSVAILALRRFVAGELQSAESLHAMYVRPSDAEINEACQ